MSKRGFSIIELLVSVAILTLIAAFVVPNYQIILTQIQLSQSAQELADTLRLNEQKTVTEQVVYGVTFTTNATTVPQYSCDDSTCGNKTALDTFVLPANIKIYSVNFSNNADIHFNTAGSPNVSGNVVLIDTTRNRKRKVEIRPSGAVLANTSEY